MFFHRLSVSLPALLAVLYLPSAWTQTAPDAGVLQQQIERARPPALPGKVAPPKPAEPPAMKPLAGASVTVKSFRFSGNTLLGSEALAALLQPYLNRPLSFAELQKAVAEVEAAYRVAGWIVRVYLPAQDVVDGVITIQIVEAVFGGVVIEGVEPSRYSTRKLLDIFQGQQKVGERLGTDALDRALLIADDMPGVAVIGSLRPGQQQGQTELVLKLADEPLAVGDTALDNTGARSTGADRFSANVTLNSPFGAGDALSTNYLHTEGSDYLRVGATVPVAANGWRVGANASALSYKLVAPEFTALNAKGTSNSVGVETSYPLVRSRMQNVYLLANLDRKNFDNESSGTTTTHYSANVAGLGLMANVFDSIGGGGANSFSLMWVAGDLNLGGSPNEASDATTTQAAGRYNKVKYSASRQQVLTRDLSLFASLSGQVAGKNLDSSEKFYLGGANGVRAYPSSEGGGSEGRMLNLELRMRMSEGLTLTGFYDYGQVMVNKNNDYSGAVALNEYSLKGAGLSLAWQPAGGLNLRATWARRLGDNPNPASSGNDQDGSFVRDRLWLSATYSF